MPGDRSVALFITCLADSCAPGIGFAALKVFAHCGIRLEVPMNQMCCGQPAYNAGYRREARRAALSFYETFRGYDHIVSPSGSCVSMVRNQYRELLGGELKKAEIERFCSKFYECSEYLVHIAGVRSLRGRLEKHYTFHPSCHMSRGLGVTDEPFQLLRGLSGLVHVPLSAAEECCGFGGMFAFKLPEMSTAMADEKLEHVVRTGVGLLIGSDYGCLMHLKGRMERVKLPVEVLHYMEVLAQGISDEYQ